MMNNRVKLMVAAVTALSISSAWGQDQMSAGSMQESAPTDQVKASKGKAQAQHGKKKPAKTPPKAGSGKEMMEMMPGMDHGGMSHEATPAMAGSMPGMKHDESDGDASTPKQDMSGMDHGSGAMDNGDMKMQGGSAPPDARDPHAWSGGYTLDSGPYALPGQRRLRLADERNFGALLVDRLERVYTNDGNATAYDALAWFGRDYDRLVLKAEGDIAGGKLQDARTELLWGHAVATFWDTQLGARYDSGVGPGRGWLALGVQGLAPYWFDVEATAYLGEQGRSALRLAASYDLLLTQKLILQPRVEASLYGKRDAARAIGSGLSDGAAGLRLRYEITRQIAPYVGVEWAGKFGESADFARTAGKKTDEARWVAGMRFWF
jgi:copper resistance protein B